MPSSIRRVLRGVKCRIAIFRYGTFRVHPTAYLAKHSGISKDFIAHEHSYLGPFCLVGPKVELGAYTMVGPRVIFAGDDHVFDQVGLPSIFSGRPELRPTKVGRDVWIGANSVIMAGVEIGDGSIVAAGSVVNRDISPCEIHGGVPNKKLRDRFPDETSTGKHLEAIRASITEGDFCAPIDS